MDNSDIMTLQEVADYLKIVPKTVMRMIARNEIPCMKVAGQWRFKRKVIDVWLNSKMSFSEEHQFAQLMDVPNSVLQLSRLIIAPYMLLDLKSTGVEDSLWELTAPLQQQGLVSDRTSLVRQLLAREEMVTTAFGAGTAFPHLRDVKSVPSGFPPIIMGISRKGVTFGNLHGEATHIFFLLLAPNETTHLRILSRLARFSQKEGMKQTLVAVATSDEVSRLLLEDDYESMAQPAR
ncbi:MAG: helix-turn-helix domain-containing protein [Spirochaetia bacterium]|jgi:PTS system nitrogen regulatory IIA component|nr:helix-turn-helix domain-containing protein [Spirochaetia bacterium]